MAMLTMNEVYYNERIKKDFYLQVINYNKKGLFIASNNEVLKKVPFDTPSDLAKLPIRAYQIKDPFAFLDILETNTLGEKIFKEIDDNKDYDENLTAWQKINRYFQPIRNILVKDVVSSEDLEKIKDFINIYTKMVNASGFLSDNCNSIFLEMSSIVSYTADDANIKKDNYAFNIMREHSINMNTGNPMEYQSIGSEEKGYGRSLINPNVPKTSEEPYLDKAGFFSFMTLLYIAFNLLVALVILAIKK